MARKIDQAAKLKTKKGVEFLKLLRYTRLTSELDNIEIKQPSHPLVNDLTQRIEAHLATTIFINEKGFLSCSFEVIDSFFHKFYFIMHDTLTFCFLIWYANLVD